jgi:hypothetical protein
LSALDGVPTAFLVMVAIVVPVPVAFARLFAAASSSRS